MDQFKLNASPDIANPLPLQTSGVADIELPIS
jgi:hypothetical protein